MPKSPARRGAVLLASAAGAAIALTGVVAPVSAADGVLPVGAQASSKNVQLQSNTPKSGAFAGPSSYNSDLAFQGDYAYQGNYDGFTVWDVSTPESPVQAAQVLCPGAQNDVSVTGDLLFLSTDSTRSDDSCSSQGLGFTAADEAGTSYWEGIKIFDVSDPSNPRYVTSVETDCGSHTHTLVPGATDDVVHLYVSSYSPRAGLDDCQPPHDKISIVTVPLTDPAGATVTEKVLFPDGGFEGDRVQGQDESAAADVSTSATTGCHDITVFPAKNLAAGACMGDGVLWDITDRLNPVEISRVQDDINFAFWHSATFNNSGTKVVFTDELGGGGAATCTAGFNPKRGANGIYDIVGKQLVFKSYYKIPRANSDKENCVAHNGSLVPVPGRDVMVQSWYQGGISVFDFTDSSKPVELGYFDRGPLSAEKLVLGGTWSAYWYNGHVYSSDIQQGFDVLKLTGSQFARAQGVKYEQLNVQSQPVFSSKPGRGGRG